MPIRIGVLLSGTGSNFEAIAHACRSGRIDGEVVMVLSDRRDAGGLEIARELGIEARHLDPVEAGDRDAYGRRLGEALDTASVDLVVLAGFMRILSQGFVSRFSGRCLNVHPSLLPEFRGLHPHRQALSAGVQLHGTSVHFVTEELDGGPVVAQMAVPVEDGDDEPSLEARVKRAEHRLYPEVVAWFAEGRLRMDQGDVILDGERLQGPLRKEIST